MTSPALTAYPKAWAVTADLCDGDEVRDVDLRQSLVDEVLSGLVLEPLTYVWAFSKPPLVVSKVLPKSLAAKLGFKAGERISGVSSSMVLPHTVDDLTALLAYAASRPRSPLTLHTLRDEPQPDESRMLPLVRPAALILDCVIGSALFLKKPPI